jgi:hypothetical protein
LDYQTSLILNNFHHDFIIRMHDIFKKLVVRTIIVPLSRQWV